VLDAVQRDSSDTMSLSTASIEQADDAAGAARKSRHKSSQAAALPRFTSTKEAANARWPLAYVTFRHNVADRLGTTTFL